MVFGNLFCTYAYISLVGSLLDPYNGGLGRHQQYGHSVPQHLGCGSEIGAGSTRHGIFYRYGESSGGAYISPVPDACSSNRRVFTIHGIGYPTRPCQKTAHLGGVGAPVGLYVGLMWVTCTTR